ncbi:MAG TPA: flagellar basal body P-ring formation chaperone FlgA [Halanaerobiales bacterium]|nr:flagellar basal body P-ring formation chaperone FlgA [Halanaerobiales bacterium]
MGLIRSENRLKGDRLIISPIHLITVLLVMLPIILIPCRADYIKIQIPDWVEVKQSRIILGDIARIEGLGGDMLNKLQSLDLGRAVLPGYSRKIYRNEVILLIENLGIERSALNLEMPSYTEVETASQVLSAEKMLAGSEKFIRENFDFSPERIEISPRFIPKEMVLPERDYQLIYQLSSYGEIPGPLSIIVRVMFGEQEYRRIYLNFRVSIIEEAYVALRSIDKGERINQQDFSKEIVKLDKLQGNLIRDFENTLVKHGVANIPIGQGEVLSDYYLILPDLVKSGDDLIAEVVIGNIVVSAAVKARQNGKYGDYITVVNTSTGHRFKAQVINSHLVRYTQD